MIKTGFLTFLILLFSSHMANATTYDSKHLAIFSKLIPRVLIFTSQYNKITDTMNICILHDEKDMLISDQLAKTIHKSYPKGIKNHPIDIKSKLFSEIDTCKDTLLIFLLNTNKTTVDNVLKFSKKHHILTMSYNPELLDYGVTSSISIKRNIKPYLNLIRLKDEGITVKSVLISVSKIYKSDTK